MTHMKLTALLTDTTVSEPIVVVNRDDALEMGVGVMDRVRISMEGSVVSTVIISNDNVMKGTIAIPINIMKKCGIEEGHDVEVEYSPLPASIRSIRKKINGGTLEKEEIDSIVNDIMAGNLSDKEIIAFVSSFNVNNSNLAEVAYLTRSMAATGKTVDLGVKPIFDFHSLGGVPGNKITPIVVSIVASEGLVIPKFSSRAISSACGTSDYVDTFCDVEMGADELVEAIRKVGGVFACGNDDYAPVGHFIIKAERPMGIDPRPTMMASIMSKKVAIGTTHLVIDIPLGGGGKIPDMEVAKEFASELIGLGTILGIHVECAVSYAGEPLGRTIGPILEAKECIGVLENGSGDESLIDKACGMAGIILEMAGEPDGKVRALEILRSGKAYEKFLQIVEVQNGDPKIRSDDLVPGPFYKDVHAKYTGKVQYVDNSNMVAVAKAAGAPSDLGAGVELFHGKGDEVQKGDALFRIFAESQAKLDRAVESARSRRPMRVATSEAEAPPESMIIQRIPSKEMLDLIRFNSRQNRILDEKRYNEQ